MDQQIQHALGRAVHPHAETVNPGGKIIIQFLNSPADLAEKVLPNLAKNDEAVAEAARLWLGAQPRFRLFGSPLPQPGSRSRGPTAHGQSKKRENRVGFADRGVHDLEPDCGSVAERNAGQSIKSFGGSIRGLKGTETIVCVKTENRHLPI